MFVLLELLTTFPISIFSYPVRFRHRIQIQIDDRSLMAAHHQSALRHRLHAHHIDHVHRSMRELRDATSDLMAQRGRRQRQNARIDGEQLAHHFGGMNLEGCVLLHARAVVGGDVSLDLEEWKASR